MSTGIEKVLFIAGDKAIGEAHALLKPTADPEVMECGIALSNPREPVSGDCIRRADGATWELRSGLSWSGGWLGSLRRVSAPVGKKAAKPTKKAVQP